MPKDECKSMKDSCSTRKEKDANSCKSGKDSCSGKRGNEMKIANSFGTNFTTEDTQHHDFKDGQPGLRMMSDVGAKIAAKSAPTSLSKDTGKITTSGVDRKMRGGR
jgi:hypothetical protein